MRWGWLFALGLAACGGAPAAPSTPRPVSTPPPPKPDVTISVIGLNDLHGRITALPVFAGYVNNLRAARARDGGGVLVVDAGDMFQGSLESNLTEGQSVFDAYHELSMNTVAIGNHEFDFGPVGEGRSGGDPQGALKARIREAAFPVLSANLVGENSRALGHEPSARLEVGGVSVRVIGALTVQTPDIVMPAYFEGLEVVPPEGPIRQIVDGTRYGNKVDGAPTNGADLVIALVHLGADCKRFEDPHDLTSCTGNREAFELAEALPQGTVDAIFAGHTHAGVAHFVNSIPVVEAYSRGKAFSRVDFVLDGERRRVKSARPFPPHDLCPDLTTDECPAGEYEGAPVVPDARVAAAIAPALELAREKRAKELGPMIVTPITRAHGKESPLGNLFTDLMLEAVPGADAAIYNGGGLRADLPAGPLRYGALYEAMPFDNRLARLRMTGAELARVLSAHLSHGEHGIVSIAGLRVTARCDGGTLRVELRRKDGRRVRPDEMLVVVSSDYLATGGDRLFEPAALPKERIEKDLGESVRDALAEQLAKRTKLEPAALFDATRPRLVLPSARPIACGAVAQ